MIYPSKIQRIAPVRADQGDRWPQDIILAEKLTARDCTLDGKPAIVAGRLNRFATVAPLDGSPGVEFAWSTVDRILSSGGEFKS